MVCGLLSDKEWAFFAPFVIEQGPKRGRPPADHRRVLDAVFWVARTGSPWRDLPDTLGRWDSVYQQFRRWTQGGLWDVLLEALAGRGAVPDSVQMIDSTIVRAHHCAAGAKKGGRRDSARHQGLGRSRGGLTTKVHVRANAAGLPVGLVITPGEAHEATAYPALMNEAAPAPKVLIADRGYDADAIRADVEEQGGTPAIPTKRNRRIQLPVDGFIYALRNRIERTMGLLKNARRVATRYDKTATSYLGFVQLAAIRLWINHFINTS